MPLPETIPVRYTEEEADNFSIRPVKRQTFRLRELVDMILRVTGKDQARVQQILKSGTLVYHFFRYWWPGIETDAAELAALLAEFPGDEPRRAFRADECALIILEPATAGRRAIEIDRGAAERKPLFAARSFWDCLIALTGNSAGAAAGGAGVTYAGYSFDRRADLFQVTLTANSGNNLPAMPRNLRRGWCGQSLKRLARLRGLRSCARGNKL